MRNKDNPSPLPGALLTGLLAGLVLCALFALLYGRWGRGWMLSCAVTFGTTACHILIRLLTPVVLAALTRKRYDPQNSWFRQKSWEPALYRRLGVKRWKKWMPSYDPREFSLQHHSLEEIVNNMCHAELVHTLIIPLSFTTLLFAIPFGAFPVFLITAFLGALLDLAFVLIQRYNRPRVMALLARGNP